MNTDESKNPALTEEAIRSRIAAATGIDIGRVRLAEALTATRGAMRIWSVQTRQRVGTKKPGTKFLLEGKWQVVGMFAPPNNAGFTAMMEASEN